MDRRHHVDERIPHGARRACCPPLEEPTVSFRKRPVPRERRGQRIGAEGAQLQQQNRHHRRLLRRKSRGRLVQVREAKSPQSTNINEESENESGIVKAYRAPSRWNG
jgi:hypothetical protein